MDMFPSFNKSPVEDDSSIGDDLLNKNFKLIDYSIDQILNLVENIDMVSDKEIKDIIVRQHRSILSNNVFLTDKNEYAKILFTNHRFLKILYEIIGTIQLDSTEVININKLCYDYQHYNPEDKDTIDLMMMVTYVVNMYTSVLLSPQLCGNEYSARSLAMISRSSFDGPTNIHRINDFLINFKEDITAENICNIYNYLFDDFTIPFISTMNELPSPNFTKFHIMRFDQISQAMILIMTRMSTPKLKKLLYEYAFYLKLYNIENVRFSLKSITGPEDDILIKRFKELIYIIEHDPIDDLIVP